MFSDTAPNNNKMKEMLILRQYIKATVQAFLLRAGALVLLFCLLLTGCNNETPDEVPTESVRTLLFYMGGDNNLSAEVNYKIEEILAVPLVPGYRLLIFADTRNVNPQLLEVVATNSGNRIEVLLDYPELNSADSDVFESVLHDVQYLCPAPSYGLIVFSHATGWLPEGTYNTPADATRSFIKDGTAEMDISSFATVVPDGMFDFIIFEACYMACVEVAYELRNKTDYIIASSAEIVSPGFSRCYDKALPYLFVRKADLRSFCRTVRADYSIRTGDYASLTLSLIETKGMAGLAEAVRGIGLPVTENNVDVQAFDRGGGNLFFDLLDTFKKVVPRQSAALQSAIDCCVQWKTATPAFMPNYGGFEITEHCGLTVYIPQKRYTRLNEDYKKLAWYRDTML